MLTGEKLHFVSAKIDIFRLALTIAKAKRYTDITELTPELLRLFIQKIVVHEKSTKWSKKAMQTIEIHYSDIGFICGDIPQDKESPRQEISA